MKKRWNARGAQGRRSRDKKHYLNCLLSTVNLSFLTTHHDRSKIFFLPFIWTVSYRQSSCNWAFNLSLTEINIRNLEFKLQSLYIWAVYVKVDNLLQRYRWNMECLVTVGWTKFFLGFVFHLYGYKC